ncbi:MAG: mevalonate kinase [Promethearchaeota archaeon]
MKRKIHIKAPGRICLFGEHQDYLGLPVISAAISLYIHIKAKQNNKKTFNLHFQDLNKTESISLDGQELEYQSKRDYIKSAYNILLRKGYSFKEGYNCQIYGNIPMGAGAASSSALTVAWVVFLLNTTRTKLSLPEIADIAHAAEVIEFQESGGKMDHTTSVFGNLLYMETREQIFLEHLNAKIREIVLGDSREKKTTVGDLFRVKTQVLEEIKVLRQKLPEIDLKSTRLKEIEEYLDNSEISKKIYANIINRDLTQEAKVLLKDESFDKNKLGVLLNKHHIQLSENLGVSTKKIDSMIDAALNAGALGAKINGSGFGGTMFAYAPNYEKEVAKAIRNCGGTPYNISIVSGVNLHDKSNK